ncbi:hypothetical protein ACNSOL_04415 [Aliarcobacter lanthieri]|uniref:hypothetical protein n=1 Tax=Aliarcobacter lanthieri TaxID=1355374 RepID=UPI003AAC832B
MENNLIHKFQYTKNPYKEIYFSFTIKIFLFMLFVIFLISIYKNSYSIFLLLCFFSILMAILFSLMYSPVILRLNSYLSLEIYKNKLLIDEKSYPLNEISYKINEYIGIGAGSYKINIHWISIQFFNNKNRKIGEFFFTISYENDLANISLKTLTKIIDDLKNNEDYDYKAMINQQLKEFQAEEKVYNYAYYMITLWILAPFFIAVLIYLLKN